MYIHFKSSGSYCNLTIPININNIKALCIFCLAYQRQILEFYFLQIYLYIWCSKCATNE